MKKSYFIIIAIVVAAAIALALYINYQKTHANTQIGFASSNGRLQLQSIDVASLRAGRVSQVLVHEGDLVEKGTPLVTLSSEELDTQLQAAEAAKAQAQAAKVRALGAVSRAMSSQKRAEGGYARTQSGITQAEAQIAAQVAQLTIAKNNLDNTRALRKDELVSVAELQQREQAYDAAKAAVLAAQAGKGQASAGSQEAQAAIAEAQSGVQEAKAAVAEADAAIMQAQSQIDRVKSIQSDLYVRAPQSGRVEYTIATVGNVIAPGNKVITLVDPADVYLEIFLPTDSSSQVQIGSAARVVLDGIEAVFPAKVSFVASQSQFTPKSVETKNEREKMMYRVKLSIDPSVASRYQTLLKGGMTAQGYVQLDTQRAWDSKLTVKLPASLPVAPSQPIKPASTAIMASVAASTGH